MRGALIYEPEIAEGRSGAESVLVLDTIATEANALIAGSDSEVIRELERIGGTSGGARPKAHILLNEENDARTDVDEPTIGFEPYIVKFASTADHFQDIGPLEAAYTRVAALAGLDVPHTRLIRSSAGPGHFATKRFDRAPEGNRVHMLSLAGLLDADWSIPSISYGDALRAVRSVTRDQTAVEEFFRRMVFNVVFYNRDDHAKQHAFLQTQDGAWRLAPAYDLTYSSGPGGEHYLSVNGKGREISRDDALAVAKQQSIPRSVAEKICDGVLGALAEFPKIMHDFGVSAETRAEVLRKLNSLARSFHATSAQ